MSREFNKFNANLKNIHILINIFPIAIKKLPKLIIEKYGIFFKKMYSEDILNLINLIRKNLNSKEHLKKRFDPIFDKKFSCLEKHLKNMHNKVASLVLKDADMQQKKRMSLEASLVLMVAYFEDFLKESFKRQINKKPTRSLPFLEKQIRINDLKEFGFDLSKKMGSLVARKINFQNLEDAASAYKLTLGIDIFRKNLVLKKKVMKLFQIRHLIVHNNNKIDNNYLKIVKCRKNQLGKKVNLPLKDLNDYKSALLVIANYVERNRIK